MSFLFPLYAVGLAALVLPLLLHLARKRTLFELPWSSLRFLRAVPPPLERRRRIEDWLLLLTRCLVLAALVAAFTRPFFTRPLPALAVELGARHVVLIDASASMRRSGVFPAAITEARKLVAAARPDDRLALMVFGGGGPPRTIVSFDEWKRMDAAARGALGEGRLAALAPGWGGTDLGRALNVAADAVVDDEEGETPGARPATVTLISDLHDGAKLSALGPAGWPAHVMVRVLPVAGERANNLALHPVPPRGDLAPAGPERVRVRVAAYGGPGDGSKLNGRLRWSDDGALVEVSLAAGESRIVEAPPRAAAGGTLLLQGDRDDFDNSVVVAPAAPVESRIVYVGDDDGRGDGGEKGSFYFLARAFPQTRAHAPVVTAHKPGDDKLAAAIARADLVVATAALPSALVPALRTYLAGGHTLLFAPINAAAGASLALVADAATFADADAGREAVLTKVDLGHPWLATFAEGGAGDFTQIRFWRHRPLALSAGSAARVLGRFDNGDPAWVTLPVGRGQVFVMTSGWAPGDSQLGLSSKLVPLLWNLLQDSGGVAMAELAPVFAGDALPVAGAARTQGPGRLAIERPDGRTVVLPAESSFYPDADLPGLYRVGRGAEAGPSRVIAVNVPPSESAVAPLPLEHLERAGIPLFPGPKASPAAPTNEGSRAAALAAHAAALEAAQKPWRWALGAGLLLLLLESWLSARRMRRPAAGPAEVMA